MKFAQYLHDTQTPEWKKAYIDYRGLKKRITAIRKVQQGLQITSSAEDSPNEIVTPPATPRASFVESDQSSILDTQLHERRALPTSSMKGPSDHSSRLAGKGISKSNGERVSSAVEDVGSDVYNRRPSVFGGKSSARGRGTLSSRIGGMVSRPTNPLAALPLHDLLTQLSPHEVSFFTMLDAQLDKVESFYLSREQEMLLRGKMLEQQLRELHDHRKLFLEAHAKVPWAAAFTASLKPRSKRLRVTKTVSVSEDLKGKQNVLEPAPHHGFWNFFKTNHRPAVTTGENPLSPTTSIHPDNANERSESTDDDAKVQEETDEPRHIPLSADPDNYLYAKRKLKKAVTEHYRGLEVLHNYRVLNITGFRKALKKFEKVTKIPVQNQYMTEKVEKSAFASDKGVRQMMKDMEDMYAIAFVHGNKKKATKRLRGGSHVKSHHFSTFRSGLMLGFAVPALISGFVNAFQHETRQAMPAWGALMFIYGVLLIPTLFTTLIGLNLLVWARSRINYVFIFELNVLTCLDYREYFEIPSMLIAGLCYSFWLSFARIGSAVISPSIWPLVWLGAVAIVVLDPVPFLFRPSRYWLLRVVAKLFLSGMRRVEFTDFWMGDQFCSLIFTLSNLYFFLCVYVDGFSIDWRKCGVTSKHWPVAFVLAALPFLIRLIQSIKRYYDSRLITHLINGGKYASGLLANLLYFIWRHEGTPRVGPLFAMWCFFHTVYTIYACSWDFLMDWSVLRLHVHHPLLRAELVYTNHIPMYYFAIITNIFIRFIWVIYIPQKGPDFFLRTFIAAFFEMLRRWQWNFYRLENEHLGNMDQYRVTREVPLPYLFDDPTRDDDRDDEDTKHLEPKRHH